MKLKLRKRNEKLVKLRKRNVSEKVMRAEQAVAVTKMELRSLETEVDALTQRLEEVMEHIIAYFPSGVYVHLFST